MPADSPQSVTPVRRDTYSLLRDAIVTQESLAQMGSNVIEGTNQTKVALIRRPGAAFRQIQNCGTTPVKYLADDNNDCSANNFHGILAPGSAIDDGLGSVAQFGVTPTRVTVFSAGAFRVAVFEGVAPEGL